MLPHAGTGSCVLEDVMADALPADRPDEEDVNTEKVEGQRSAWIVTGYGIFALALLSLVAYSVAQYAVR